MEIDAYQQMNGDWLVYENNHDAPEVVREQEFHNLVKHMRLLDFTEPWTIHRFTVHTFEQVLADLVSA